MKPKLDTVFALMFTVLLSACGDNSSSASSQGSEAAPAAKADWLTPVPGDDWADTKMRQTISVEELVKYVFVAHVKDSSVGKHCEVLSDATVDEVKVRLTSKERYGRKTRLPLYKYETMVERNGKFYFGRVRLDMSVHKELDQIGLARAKVTPGLSFAPSPDAKRYWMTADEYTKADKNCTYYTWYKDHLGNWSNLFANGKGNDPRKMPGFRGVIKQQEQGWK